MVRIIISLVNNTSLGRWSSFKKAIVWITSHVEFYWETANSVFLSEKQTRSNFFILSCMNSLEL